MKIRIKHITDNEKISVIRTEAEILEFTRTIIDENQDALEFQVENVQECLDYINAYCPNLKVMSDVFTFFWLDGKREVLEGNDQAHALNSAGYGNGALRALDFWANGDNNDYFWNKESKNWDMTPEASKKLFGK